MSSKEVKILHCADLHLGVEFTSLGDNAAQRKRENFLVLEHILSICREEKVDFLLLSGDLFDHIHIESQIITEVLEQFSRIPDTIIAIAPGNHDPFSIDSCYYARKWPENVLLFQNEWTSFLFEEKNVCLWGAGFQSTYHPDSFFSISQNDLDTDRINICVIHGDLVPQGQTSLYNPISKNLIRQSGFDYIALGHVHKRTVILREGKTFYAYPGCPEGHGFDELGEQGVYLGTVSKGRHSLRFRKTCSRCYYEVLVSIDHAQTNQEIAESVIAALNERFPDDAKDHLYKIILKGEIPESLTMDLEGISQRIESNCYFSKIENQTTLELDYELLAKEQTLKGIFTRKMLDEIARAKEKKDEASISMAQNALQYGLKAFDGEVVWNED